MAPEFGVLAPSPEGLAWLSINMSDLRELSAKVQAVVLSKEGHHTPDVTWDDLGVAGYRCTAVTAHHAWQNAVAKRCNKNSGVCQLSSLSSRGRGLEEGPELLNKYVGESERAVRQLFARAPGRVSILKAVSRKSPLAADVDFDVIGNSPKCNGFSGADMAALVREACVLALKESIAIAVSTNSKDPSTPLVYSRHFDAAMLRVVPSVSKKDQKQYDSMRNLRSSRARLVPVESVAAIVDPTAEGGAAGAHDTAVGVLPHPGVGGNLLDPTTGAGELAEGLDGPATTEPIDEPLVDGFNAHAGGLGDPMEGTSSRREGEEPTGMELA
eukprot:gene6545-3191_t